MRYPGSDIKYRVTATDERLDLDGQDFTITVKNRWGAVAYKVKKDECFQDSEESWYFTLESVPNGVYYAYFVASVPDEDYDKLTATVTDEQYLMSVGVCETHRHDIRCCQGSSHAVKYEEVWTANLDDGTYLADKDGNLQLTSDGARIQIKPKK